MSGKEVKDILLKNNYKLKDIAFLMEETPQNLNSMLKAEDIKTGVLEKIATSINKSLYFFFTQDDDSSDVIPSESNILISYIKEKDEKIEKLIKENTELEAQLKMYKKSHAQMDGDATCANVKMKVSG